MKKIAVITGASGGLVKEFVRQIINKKFSEFSLVDLVYALILGFCLFSLAQYENLLWGFQIAWILVEFCAVMGLIAFCLYIDTRKRKYIVISLILAFVSSFSSLHGLVIWPCYMSVAVIYMISIRHFDRDLFLFVSIPMILCYVVYGT